MNCIGCEHIDVWFSRFEPNKVAACTHPCCSDDNFLGWWRNEVEVVEIPSPDWCPLRCAAAQEDK